jgi:hypothetical protein
MGEATGGFLERPDHAETPDRKWLGEGDSLERLFWQVGLPGVELTPLAREDNLLYNVQRSQPVKTLAKGLADQ